MTGILREFRDFILRGNVIDMAVGIIAGAAFTTLVKSMVEDIMTPGIEVIVAAMSGGTLEPFALCGSGVAAGDPCLNMRAFFNNGVIFFLTMVAVFFFVVKPMNAAMRGLGIAKDEEETPMRSCPECLSEIPAAATRCAHCTTAVEATR